MDKIMSLLREALAVVKGSPLAAVALFLMGGGACYWLTHERLTLRDEQMAELRHKLDSYERSPSDLSKKSNADLQRAALELATKIRNLSREVSTQTDRMFQEFVAAARAAEADGGVVRPGTDPAIDKKWHDSNINMASAYERTMEKYNQLYKSDAIVMRDAILERLMPSQRVDSRMQIPFEQAYERPQNAGFIDAVATNLEVLAKKLPTEGEH